MDLRRRVAQKAVIILLWTKGKHEKIANEAAVLSPSISGRRTIGKKSDKSRDAAIPLIAHQWRGLYSASD
jgi:hypothetical protein